jgi:hypothetical protein
VSAGAGSEPYGFSGPVDLTGPYGGAPYGLSIPVAANAGPFALGTVVTRAALNVNPYTGRVTVASALPTIVKGVPLRVRSVSVAVNRANFLFNPTNCGALASESTLTSTLGASDNAASPFQVTGCGALAFTPTLKASTRVPKKKLEGVSLQVNLIQPAGQANISSVMAQLPLQLPTRLETLKNACAEATFAANPHSCPPASAVGSATVTTPVLPGALTGPAYLVSHGGAAFPDLDLALEDNGVHVILTSTTRIYKGITTSTFTGIPDAPVSSFALNLPTGRESILAVNGNLCSQPVVMPTTITAQSGAHTTQNVSIAVAGCPARYRAPRILSHRIVGHMLILKVRTYTAGRLSAVGRYLHTVTRKLRRARTVTLELRISTRIGAALHGHRHGLKLRVSVRLVPSSRGIPRKSTPLTLLLRG